LLQGFQNDVPWPWRVRAEARASDGLPRILAYTGFVFRVLRGWVTIAYVEEDKFDHLLREEGHSMWYFSRVFGVGFAVSFSIINAM
jgi:cyd operon protein YbgT